jgi:hypothetical protein
MNITRSSPPRNRQVTNEGTKKESIIGEYILALALVSTVATNYMASAPDTEERATISFVTILLSRFVQPFSSALNAQRGGANRGARRGAEA